MSLFNVNGGLELAVAPNAPAAVLEQLAGATTLTVLGPDRIGPEPLPPGGFVYPESTENRGITLETLRLKPDAQSFFKKLFHRDSTIYVLTWAYHIAAEPVSTNPHEGVPPVTLQLTANELERFLGDGLLVFPPHKVLGGIGVNIQVWESHKEERDFGEVLSKVNDALKTSKLYDLLAVAAAAATAQPELVAILPSAADALMATVSTILKSAGDSSLDVFSGFYGVNYPWGNTEHFDGHGVEVELNLLS